ncbi:uncharacterized protein LOC111345433 [Stylophora pistillata]|uniref:uncharacterized protein LOC111345433 n=1 Tax=Stylophora pistillata TaxID=50429 RepID=UPI000C04AB51|nr:uncharacterized protein LOC111345433 [Stylophora pistillata]
MEREQGRQADPTDEVSKAMRNAKDSNGERLFSYGNFLTNQQISSYFSRLASKRSVEVDEPDSENETPGIDLQSVLSDKVLSEVSIQHSHLIIYDSYNISSWSALEKQENEKNVRDPDVCSGFPLRGRRVVELNVLAKALDEGSEACGTALRLSDCIKETVSGLGSLLYICCSIYECGETNIGRTNKTHRSTGTTRGRPIFNVNTKLAAGMLHAGTGPTRVNELLSSINIPSLGESTLKARNREVGPQIEKLAKESCLESLESERNLWKDDSEQENVETGASYDIGWQKRGKAHNSLTGVGSMVGLKSGKVICYGSRSRRCATCETASRQSKEPCIHDCRLNWEGSSKAMEADGCVDLVKRGLPHGKDLMDKSLRQSLEKILEIYALNAKKLADQTRFHFFKVCKENGQENSKFERETENKRVQEEKN